MSVGLIANILMDSIDAESISKYRYRRQYFSCSVSVLIPVDDIFEASIGIEYRQYFWKVSLTTLVI